MARKPRIEYEGAVYHVMCRGNAGDDIFADDKDRMIFMQTLGEVCERCGWRIHAYVLMGNHYHFLLETPEANLVVGMKWFQGTYTQRYNARHKRRGHLFQGRYKALVVESESGDYFSTLSSYIHLNPARAGMLNPVRPVLSEYAWSSYPIYLQPSARENWLCVDRVLGNQQWKDEGSDRMEYADFMQKRTLELLTSGSSSEIDTQWNAIRKGWCLGSENFREEMLSRLDALTGERESYHGSEIRLHDEKVAEKLIVEGLRAFNLEEGELECLRKGDVRKQVLAWWIRRQTTVGNKWLCERLCCGNRTAISRFVKNVQQGNSEELDLLKQKISKFTD